MPKPKQAPYIYRIPRTYRLSPEIVAKLEDTARAAGEDKTAIIERALRIYFAANEPAIPLPAPNGKREKA